MQKTLPSRICVLQNLTLDGFDVCKRCMDNIHRKNKDVDVIINEGIFQRILQVSTPAATRKHMQSYERFANIRSRAKRMVPLGDAFLENRLSTFTS